jgi:hypothetical protein
MSSFPPGLEPVQDLSPSLWVQEALKGWPSERFRVRDLVPPVFEAYARILHETRKEERDGMRTGTWAKRAGELSREVGAETTWWQMLGRSLPYQGDRDEWTPEEGRLSKREVRTLIPFLEGHTADPATCWFGLWSGFGFLRPGRYLVREPQTLREYWAYWAFRRAERKAEREADRALAKIPTFPLLGRSGRSYHLFGGTVEDASRFTFEGWFQSPTLWWPDDRSWFVHTEIDGMSTYMGGPRSLVDRLVGEQILESFEVDADTPAAL